MNAQRTTDAIKWLATFRGWFVKLLMRWFESRLNLSAKLFISFIFFRWSTISFKWFSNFVLIKWNLWSSVQSWFWPKEVMMFETGSGQGGQAPMAMEVQIPVRKMRMVRDISNYVLLNIALGYSIMGNWGAFSMLIDNLPFVQYVLRLSTYLILILMWILFLVP